MAQQQHMGFPSPLLGMEPVRLPILSDDDLIISLAKPSSVLVQADSWYPRLPVLIEAIRYQAQQEKPEFVRLGIATSGLWAVTDLDPECHGPVLFARDRDLAESLRSDLGSGAFSFSFRFLTRHTAEEASIISELPLARHRQRPRMLVSHTTGKSARTEFQRVKAYPRFCEYTARIQFPRRHQVLLHANESGLPVLGDSLYAGDHPLMLSRIKRNYQPKADIEERPLFDGPAYYLESIELANGLVVRMDPPPRWKGLRRQLELHLGN